MKPDMDTCNESEIICFCLRIYPINKYCSTADELFEENSPTFEKKTAGGKIKDPMKIY